VKHVNTRFPDDLYDEMASAAIAEERPIGSWLRIAAKEKLARERGEGGKNWANGEWPTDPSLDFDAAGKSRIAGPVPSTSNASPEIEESLRDLSKDIAEQTRQELHKHLERNSVEPRFKKDGKK
jgi:hypothetical protein